MAAPPDGFPGGFKGGVDPLPADSIKWPLLTAYPPGYHGTVCESTILAADYAM